MKHHLRNPPPNVRGLTLLELLVVVAIVGLLAALLLPAMQSAREAARRAVCASQLRQLSLAGSSFETARGHYPPGVEQWYFNGGVSHRGIPLFAFLLPYLEADEVLVTWDYDDPIHNADQGRQSNTAVTMPVFVCPSDEIPQNPVIAQRNWVYAISSYGGNGGTRSYFPQQASADGIFHTTGEASEPQHYQKPVRMVKVTDGLSKTLLFAERSHSDANYQSFNDAGWGETLREWGWWGASTSRKMIGHVTLSSHAPLNYRLPFSYHERSGQTPSADSFASFNDYYVDLRICAIGSNHPGGANATFCDGSTRFLTDDTEHELLAEYCTRASYLSPVASQ